MIRFVHPEAWLLLPLVALVLRARLWQGPRLVTALRCVFLVAAVALLAGPFRVGRAEGRDLILVVDRSRSVPADAEATVREWAERAAGARREGDRIGVVVFGRDAAVEQAPDADARLDGVTKDVDADATDLAAALRTAAALVPPGRPGSLLVLSDGEATGADPAAAARAALRRGVRIDAVHLRRPGVADVAVDEVAAPGEVGAGEPFQFSAWIRSDEAREVPVRLVRDGVVIAADRRRLRRGLNRIVFRDRLARPGLHRYEVQVPADGDRMIENNTARAAVRVVGARAVVVVTPGGREDRLTRSLRAAGVPVAVVAPAAAPRDLAALDGVRAVVLENVAAEDLPGGAMAALRAFVRDLGGGLLMTGGGASFGLGGYHRSPVEEVLPVTMEVRQEQRKFALAMAIALDRSGSMAAPAGAGRTKMDLANLGAAAAVEVLGRRDHVAVLAVDSSPHVVVPLSRATPKGPILEKVRTIESAGGGIFVEVALRAAARELRKAPQRNKHIVLFADAADAEQPGNFERYVPALVRAGVTLSVIGLGRPTDPDAALLRDLARLGKGRCFFAADASQLPRVFAQETIQAARSSLVEEPTAVGVLPDIVALGELAGRPAPAVGGYSIAYRRDGATLGLVTKDEQAAPLLSFRQHGLGRAAAFLGEADGELSGAWATWDGYGDFFTTVARWLGGTEATHAVFADLTREGHEAVLRVEVVEGREALLGDLAPRLVAPDGTVLPVVLRRVGERRLEARIPLRGEGIYHAAVRAGEEVLRVPPVTLPYSPEFEPRSDPREGERTLARIARIAEGRVDPTLDELWSGSRRGRGVTDLGPWCALLAVALLLLEVAVRRLGLRVPRVALPALPKLARRALPRAEPEPAAPETTPEPEEEEAPSLGALLDRAKRKSRRR